MGVILRDVSAEGSGVEHLHLGWSRTAARQILRKLRMTPEKRAIFLAGSWERPRKKTEEQ